MSKSMSLGSLKSGYRIASKKLKEIQRSPDKIKKRYLVVSSGLVMLLIILLWVAYLDASLPEVEGVVAEGSKIKKSDTFFETFGRGLKISIQNIKEKALSVGEAVENFVDDFKNQIEKTKEFTVPGTNPRFVPAASELLPKTSLP